MAQEAPNALAALDELPGQIKQGDYFKAEYDDTLLGLFRHAYEEARAALRRT